MRGFVFACGPLVLAACSIGGGDADANEPGIAGQGTGNARTYAVADFDSIDLRGSDDVDVRVGSGFSVRAEGDAKVLDRLRITREGQRLRIDRKPESGISWGGGDAKLLVTMPRIAGAKVSGSGDVTIDRAEGTRFDGAIAGSGGLSIDSMQVDEARLAVAGSGDMEVKGTAQRLDVSVAGSGSLDAPGLKTKAAKVSVAGSGTFVPISTARARSGSQARATSISARRRAAPCAPTARAGHAAAAERLHGLRRGETVTRMLRPLLAGLLAALIVAAPAAAADRTVGIGSFDRIRIDGAFDVRIATGKSPRASMSGDARALDQVDLRVEGMTLHLRRRGSDSAAARAASGPVVVTLAAPALTSAAMLGSGKLAVTGMRGERADLSVAGSGTIAVEAMDVQRGNASIVGGGRITLAGRATRVRLSTNGPGTIDAAKLVADDLTIRLDGPGETLANARYIASVTATGLGRIVVTGNAKCTVRAPSADIVSCGAR